MILKEKEFKETLEQANTEELAKEFGEKYTIRRHY